MKRITNVFTMTLLLLAVIAGCSKPENQSAQTAATPAASPSAASAPGTDLAKSKSVVTQKEANITMRVDKPEFEPFLKAAKPGPVIPGLLQDYIPQGITYLEEQNWILVSYYREDKSPSILTVIDAKSGELIKSLQLYKEDKQPYNEHAGGVTVSSKYVWISSNGNMYYIKKEDLIQSQKEDKLYFQGHFKTDLRASFTTYSDGVLWVGEFTEGTSDYPTSSTHYVTNRDNTEYRAWAEGFKLDEQTDLPLGQKIDGDITVPNYVLAIPNRIQGMTVLPDQIILSESYGRNNDGSVIFHRNVLAEEPHKQVDFGSNQVPLWFLDSKNHIETITGPPMTEGIAAHNNSLYVLFESGATKFRTSGSYPLDRIYTLELKSH